MAETTDQLQRLFDVFRDEPFDIDAGLAATRQLCAVEDTRRVTDTTIGFIGEEEDDWVRAWGMGVLGSLHSSKPRRDSRVFDFICGYLKETAGADASRANKYTRMFALRTLSELPKSALERDQFIALLNERRLAADEDALPKAVAACISARMGNREAQEQVEQMLAQGWSRYWFMWAVLRALREFPLDGVVSLLVQLIRDERGYLDHRHEAIRVLSGCSPTSEVVRAVGEVLATNRNGYLRLRAAITLGALADAHARTDLVEAVKDHNAEVRVQASMALGSCLPKEEAVGTLVEAALSPDIGDDDLNHFIEAIRMVDRERVHSAEILGKEMTSEDRRRSLAAERILLELGGWSAVHRLSQRRDTLAKLDDLLSQSERVVQETFQRTITQARVNFYFGLAVNILVVTVGVAFVVLAVLQLLRNPENLESWLVPGGTGVIGVIINQMFNNPRRHARDDLTTLINVNILFLGFLRQLNEIDATFKHAYIESRAFGPQDMLATVAEIEKSVSRTLAMASRHLRWHRKEEGPEMAQEKMGVDIGTQSPRSPMPAEA